MHKRHRHTNSYMQGADAAPKKQTFYVGVAFRGPNAGFGITTTWESCADRIPREGLSSKHLDCFTFPAVRLPKSP